MADIRDFFTTAGGNNASGGLFVEGLLGSLTTDNLRELQAALRKQWNQAQWFSLGAETGPATYTFLSATSFRVVGSNNTPEYHAGRRVRATGSATGTITGTVTSSTANGSDLDVTVVWDSGALQSETLLIELAIISADGGSVPGSINHAVTMNALLRLTSGLSVEGSVTVDGNITGQEVTVSKLIAADGPFRLLNVEQRLSGFGPISFDPTDVKFMIMEVWGAGGGASSSPNGFGQPVAAGGAGGTFTISSNSGGLTVSVTGGAGGGAGSGSQDGQSQRLGNGGTNISDPNGQIQRFIVLPGLGAPGGVASVSGVGGNPGDYAKVFIKNPTFTQLSAVGGVPGVAGSNPGRPLGGAGGGAFYTLELYG